MPTVHHKWGGSTIARTLSCPDWVNIAALGPKIDRTSDAAERGTKLHDVMERIYGEGVGLEYAVVGLSQDDADAVRVTHRMTEALFNKYGIDEVVCEAMVLLEPDVGGSCDLAACSPEVFIAADFKFGRGKAGHDQVLFYALGVLADADLADMAAGKTIVTAILQPELSDDADVKTWTTVEVTAFHERVLAAVKHGKKGGADGVPGKHCLYCPGAVYCTAKKKQVGDFLLLDPATQQSLDDAAALLDVIKEHVRAIEAEMLFALEAGLPVAGYKLVEKQGREHWVDPDAALDTFKRSKLRKEIYLEPDKLRSPTQIKVAIKAAGKTYDVAGMTSSASSGTTYAPVTDKRAPVLRGGDLPKMLDDVLNKV